MGRKTRKSKISFETETVTIDHAKQIVSTAKTNQNSTVPTNKLDNGQEVVVPVQLKLKKKRKSVSEGETQNSSDKGDLESELSKTEVDEKAQHIAPSGEKKESNRARKRQKYAQLVEEKKSKADLEMQQKTLNYLSKWKHSRSEWKFEKLRQIWLQQHLLDVNKIPSKFWDTTVQYFSGSKGHSRQAVLENAVKVIEADENVSEEDRTDDYETRLKRARDIVQNLQ